MNRKEIVRRIAEELLKNEVLNEFDYEASEFLLEDVEEIIGNGLKDYLIIQGSILE